MFYCNLCETIIFSFFFTNFSKFLPVQLTFYLIVSGDQTWFVITAVSFTTFTTQTSPSTDLMVTPIYLHKYTDWVQPYLVHLSVGDISAVTTVQSDLDDGLSDGEILY